MNFSYLFPTNIVVQEMVSFNAALRISLSLPYQKLFELLIAINNPVLFILSTVFLVVAFGSMVAFGFVVTRRLTVNVFSEEHGSLVYSHAMLFSPNKTK
jgi:hypothetical protein